MFLNPTPEWQRSVLEQRPMPSSDPARALANRLVKDRIYADRVAALAYELGFPVLEMDGSTTAIPSRANAAAAAATSSWC